MSKSEKLCELCETAKKFDVGRNDLPWSQTCVFLCSYSRFSGCSGKHIFGPVALRVQDTIHDPFLAPIHGPMFDRFSIDF